MPTANLLSRRLAHIPPTVFSEMSALALRTGAINLGQGFPDVDGPRSVVEAAERALEGGANQYAPGIGVPSLRAAIARHQQRHYGLEVDPELGRVTIAGGGRTGVYYAYGTAPGGASLRSRARGPSGASRSWSSPSCWRSSRSSRPSACRTSRGS